MDWVKEFLEERELFAYRDKEPTRVSIDEALKLINKCPIYASISRGFKASPVISITAEELPWFTILSVASYTSHAIASLGFKSNYVVFHWSGAEVVINERSLPDALFDAGAQPVKIAMALANRVIKALENRLLKISRLFKGRITFSTGLSSIPIPCSPTINDNRKTIYISHRELDTVLRLGVQDDLCIIGTPFKAEQIVEPASIPLGDVNRDSVNVEPITLKASITAMPRVVGRFEVMALLQTARYYLLTGDWDRARSFGLNRAIFYAWAKYQKPRAKFTPITVKVSERHGGEAKEKKFVEDEVEVKGAYFAFADQIQTPEDFNRVVKQKIEMVAPFEVVWTHVLKYVERFSTDILRDPNKFYRYVYEPVRDTFIENLTMLVEPTHKRNTISSRSGSRGERSLSEALKHSLSKERKLTEFL